MTIAGSFFHLWLVAMIVAGKASQPRCSICISGAMGLKAVAAAKAASAAAKQAAAQASVLHSLPN